MSKVDEAVAEIEQAKAGMATAHEGLKDYSRLDLQEETKAAVDAAIAQYDRRRGLLAAAGSANAALVADGHPDLPVREVAPQALADLQANADTINAALARFGSNATATLNLQGGPPEPR